MNTCSHINIYTQKICGSENHIKCHDGESYCKIHIPTQDCPICFESTNNQIVDTLKCDHSFHRKCLNKWIQHGGETCPMCRIHIFNQQEHREQYIENDDDQDFIHSFPIYTEQEELQMSTEEAYNALNLFFLEGYHIPDEVYDESISLIQMGLHDTWLPT
jgi:hypothetical protein